MNPPPSTPRSEPKPARVAWSGGVLEVQNESLLGLGADGHTRRFLERAFYLAEVASVSIDRAAALALVRPVHTPPDPQAFIRTLAAALRSDDGLSPTLPRGVRESTFTVYRHGALLSTCEVVIDQPGLLRLRHGSLRQDAILAREFHKLMASVPGVNRTALDRRTGALTVRYTPSTVSSSRLIRLAEEALDNPGWWERAVPPPPKTSFALANANLVVGAAADLLVSALAPVSAIMLVGSNLRTFRLAWQQVRQRTVGLPVLYTVIVAGTLTGGQFLASALMMWSFRFWNARLRHDLSAERRRLLAECLPLPRLARVEVAEGEVLAPVDRLRPGDLIVVSAGDLVPADGRVIRGEGMVEQQALRALEGASRVRKGDTVLAGSTVLKGSLCVQVARSADATTAGKIGRALVAATNLAPGAGSPVKQTEVFAEQAVVPTFAMAGVGLLAGDITMASAVLRPDYATGPGVALSLETLRDATACARLGIVVRFPDSFNRLAKVDTVVLDDSPALRSCALEVVDVQSRLPEPLLLRYAASAFRHMADERAEALLDACRERHCHVLNLPAVEFDPGVTIEHGKHRVRVRELDPEGGSSGPLAVEVDGDLVAVLEFGRSKRLKAASVVERLQAQPGVSVVLLSDRPESEVAGLASRLGVTRFGAGLATSDKQRYLRECRERGARTAFIGDCRARREVAEVATVAVSTSSEADWDDDPAEVILLQPRLDLFAELCDVARSHTLRVEAAQRLVLVPNALCVAGAFLLGATALAVVVISNLSTLELYRRASGSLAAPGRSRVPRRLVSHSLGV